MQKIKKGMLFTTITFLYSSILYFLVFYVFGEFNNYVLCTRIDLFDSSIFGTGKFFKEQEKENKDNIYSDIDKAIKDSPKSEE